MRATGMNDLDAAASSVLANTWHDLLQTLTTDAFLRYLWILLTAFLYFASRIISDLLLLVWAVGITTTYETETLYGFNKKINQCTHPESIAECFPDHLLTILVDRLQDLLLNDQRPIRLFIVFHLHRLPVPPKLILNLLLIYRHLICSFTVNLVHAIGL